MAEAAYNKAKGLTEIEDKKINNSGTKPAVIGKLVLYRVKINNRVTKRGLTSTYPLKYFMFLV